MIILGIILILGGFIAAVVIILSEANKLAILGAVSSVLLIIGGVGCLYNYKHPQAIDVYRGKTTLQITYKNNVPIDTIVVYN